MSFLRLLEGIRNPVLNAFFGGITYFGDETLFLVIGLIIFWCIDKKAGRYLVTVGMIGTVINQFLKLVFRIPRPWVVDESFTIVESARAGAGGYSFPSGHTQTAVGVYGAFALWVKKRWLRIAAIAVAVLVPFSRMYLGVHTPLDVGVAAVTSVLLLLVLYPPMAGAHATAKSTRISFLVTLILAIGYTLYVTLWKFPADIDPHNLQEGVKNAWLLLGASAGMWAAFEWDERHVHFETKGTFLGQVLKVVIGLALVLGLRMGLKAVLQVVFHEAAFTDALRYFVMVFVAAGVWPMVFSRIAQAGSKQTA